jgi:organic radical activating enzyme
VNVVPADLLRVWGAVLSGRRPFLSIELTRECPLRCPGCYVYEPAHLNGAGPVREMADLRGDELVNAVLALVKRQRPVHLSIVGGEPLVRWRELDVLLPRLHAVGVETQVVTSAVRPIPSAWQELERIRVSVSVDGLPLEHDRRRAPATYERILRNLAGQPVVIHCTVTPAMLARESYLDDFASFWSNRPEARKIWFSLFTPQQAADSPERLSPERRATAVSRLATIAARYPKVSLPPFVVAALRTPPACPDECLFAQLTECLAPDLKTHVTPCQLGGAPICQECGCLASAALGGVGRLRLGAVSIERIFRVSRKIGRLRSRGRNGTPVRM